MNLHRKRKKKRCDKLQWIEASARNKNGGGLMLANAMPTISDFSIYLSLFTSTFSISPDFFPTLFFLLFPSTNTFTPILSHLFVVSFSRNVCLIPSHFHLLKIRKRCHSISLTIHVRIARHHSPLRTSTKVLSGLLFHNFIVLSLTFH